MRTMATSTAVTNPPRCPPTTTNIAKASNTWRESNASKAGTLGIGSSRLTNPDILREIPTRISLADPAAAVVGLNANDDDRYNHTTRSSPYPTREAPNSDPPLTTTLHDDQQDDYQAILAANVAAIAMMKQRWPSTTADARSPHPNKPDLSSQSTADTRSPNLSSLPHTTNDPLDYQSDLAAITEKIAQWKRRWTPATLNHATVVVPIDNKDANSQPLVGHPSVIVPPDSEAKQHQYTAPSPHSTIDTDGLCAPTAAAAAKSADADARLMSHPTVTKPLVETPSADPDLLCTVQSLDEFLTKYPRPMDSLEEDDPPQPHNTCLQPTCFKAMFNQQTKVLCTINVLISEICRNLPKIIEALSRRMSPIAKKPPLHPQSLNTTISPNRAQHPTRPPRNPQPCSRLATASKPLPFQHHTSVKPSKPRANRGKLAPTWAKDTLYPP